MNFNIYIYIYYWPIKQTITIAITINFFCSIVVIVNGLGSIYYMLGIMYHCNCSVTRMYIPA